MKKMKACPHCGNTDLILHEGEFIDGAQHCNACGCCFLDGQLRPGHPPCAAASLESAEAPSPPPQQTPEPDAEPDTDDGEGTSEDPDKVEEAMGAGRRRGLSRSMRAIPEAEASERPPKE
jgi:hypothetical protein